MKNIVIILLVLFSFSCGKDLYIMDGVLFANTGVDTLTVKEYVDPSCVLINVKSFSEKWENGEFLNCDTTLTYKELVCGATLEEISGYITVVNNSVKEEIPVIGNCDVDSIKAYIGHNMTIDQELFYDNGQRQFFTVLINTVVEKYRNNELYETDKHCPETKIINNVTYGEIQGYIKVCAIRKKITEYTIYENGKYPNGELQDVTVYITSDVKIIN